MPKRKKIWCTECWNSFTPSYDVTPPNDIVCPDCGDVGRVVGHIVRGLIFCNDCYTMGCNAAVCRCDCHKEEIDEEVS